MFHRIGDIDPTAIDECGIQRFIEEFAGGSDKRMTGEILIIAGLFAHKQRSGGHGPLAENGLSGVLP